MKSNMIRQVVYDLRHQPVIGIVSIIGTALSIFLIMIVVMMSRIETMPFSPESNRDRLLYGRNLHTASLTTDESGSARLDFSLAKRLYLGLKDAEAATVFTQDVESVDVCAPGAPAFVAYSQSTDHGFWKVFDFEFIAGKPYDEAAVEAGLKEAVISESVARRLYGTTDAVGREILILQQPYRVTGVVKDVSPLAKAAFAEVFKPYTVDGAKNYIWDNEDRLFGPFQAVILARSADDFPAIKAEVRSRLAVLDNELHQKGDSLVYHGQPYNQAESNYVAGSNNDSREPQMRRIRWILYAVLLLVPAINLSSMTNSRLRRRMSEIGVRRAFGCRRSSLIANIITENFLITVIGGLTGLLLCFIFGLFFSDAVFTDLEVSRSADVSMKILIDWRIYCSALIFCFILNLLSSGIPAWRASRIPPVDAINSRNI